MNVFDKIKIFVRKYPQLNKKYSEFGDKFLLKSVNGLNVIAKHLIEVKGKNPDAPLPISSGALFLEDLKAHLKSDKKFLRVPYTPAWLASSFKNPEKHPLFHRPFLKEDTLVPTKVVEEQKLLIPQLFITPVVSEAKQIDLKDIDNKTLNYVLNDLRNQSFNTEPSTPLEELELYLDKKDEDDLSYKDIDLKKIDSKKLKKIVEKVRKSNNLESPKAPVETKNNKELKDMKFKRGSFRRAKKD